MWIRRRDAKSARAVDALAYAVGQRVVFGAGKPVPGSTLLNRKLLTFGASLQ